MQKPDQKNKILLTVAGEDCSAELGQQIAAEAAAVDAHQLREHLAGELVLTTLAEEKSEEDFLTHQLELFGTRTQLDMNKCSLPDSSGGIARRMLGKLRGLVWKLLRFAFDWITFHQNAVNEQQILTLSHEVRLRRRENAELRRRIEALEKKMGEDAHG
jgi:hypothetical protein